MKNKKEFFDIKKPKVRPEDFKPRHIRKLAKEKKKISSFEEFFEKLIAIRKG